MIRSFRHKGIERFFKSGSRAGIQAAHAPRLARQLSGLDAATRPEDMNRPGWDWRAHSGAAEVWLAQQAVKASKAISGVKALKLKY
jgi:proteic killer suppression protein